MLNLTIVLRNRLSGELDRKVISFKGEEFTARNLGANCPDWILQDGDTIAICNTDSD